MYEANRIANKILHACRRRGRAITPLQLVKLVYVGHGFSLALHGRPLIDQSIEAWKYGPVVSKVYHAAKQWGRAPIMGDLATLETDFGFKYPMDIDSESNHIVEQVAERWGHLSGGALSSWTHRSDSPWAKVYRDGMTGIIIPDPLIKAYFERAVQVSKERTAASA